MLCKRSKKQTKANDDLNTTKKKILYDGLSGKKDNGISMKTQQTTKSQSQNKHFFEFLFSFHFIAVTLCLLCVKYFNDYCH